MALAQGAAGHQEGHGEEGHAAEKQSEVGGEGGCGVFALLLRGLLLLGFVLLQWRGLSGRFVGA